MSNLVTSARNQFRGKITNIVTGAVNSEVVLEIGADRIVAVITNESVKNLGLAVGGAAYAIIKASWVIVARSGLKTSSRNQLPGTVSSCTNGAVNAEVVVALSGGNAVTAIITNESAKTLGLKNGDAVTALIKASHVIVAVD
ncbi:MAG: TOBE domain-containing protein [Betaproteobacteria bacterium]|nr:TOBE domain-containing protein [Betaproteobacteria bacterium]